MNSPPTNGLIPAVFTPFDSMGELNCDIIPDYARYLKEEQKVTDIVLCGTTGEFSKLTVEERETLAEHWIPIAHQLGLKVFIQVGSSCLKDVKRLTSHAKQMGADRILCCAPYFAKPANIPCLVDFLAKVALEAPDLPFYYYHIPPFSGVSLPVIELFHEIDKSGKIPNFRGLKFTDYDMVTLREIVEYKGGKYDCLLGREDILVPSISIGIKSAIGISYNYLGKEMSSIFENFVQNLSKANESQAKCNRVFKEIMEPMSKRGIFVPKYIMIALGINVGPPREPDQPLPQKEMDWLQQKLKEIGIHQFLCNIIYVCYL